MVAVRTGPPLDGAASAGSPEIFLDSYARGLNTIGPEEV